jgi:hypothetical protein
VWCSVCGAVSSLVLAGRLFIRPLFFFRFFFLGRAFRGNAFAAGAGTGAGVGAAGGGDDVLKAVERLKEIMYFEVLQLLGQGCNGAVFKVGRARVRVFFVFVPRGCPPQFARAPIVCGMSCLLAYLLACLLAFFLHHFRCEQAKVVHPTVANGVFVALKPRHRHINRFVTEFVDLPPDAVFDELSPDLKEVGSRLNKVTGLMQRLKAQFYVVELHDMTLEAALDRFPVSTRSYYPAPYACLAEDWCHVCVLLCERVRSARGRSSGCCRCCCTSRRRCLRPWLPTWCTWT